jgi:hypothetical protein
MAVLEGLAPVTMLSNTQFATKDAQCGFGW